jgi:GNAT superfamily N-acetyltransferase
VGDVLVRRVREADAAGIVELGRIVDPDVLTTPATMRALLEAKAPPGTERLVGEIGGRVVAWAPSGLYQSGTGWFWIGVQPDFRARGIGSVIYDHVEARLLDLRADRIETTPNDDAGRQFLLSRGFRVSATVRVSEIDPRRVSAASPVPAGVEVVALRDVLDEAEALFDLYSIGRADVPSHEPRTAWTFAEWRRETLDHPLLDLDASVVVLESRAPVSFAWLYSDREGHRAETVMAATRRDRRGRGLATLAKAHSTQRAAALGITRILTGNDVDNRPMLAINDRLGYAPTVVNESYAKLLSPR